MPIVVRWSGLRLLITWVGVFASLALLRVALEAGVATAVLEDGTVRTVSGVWSRAFATWVWRLAVVVGLTSMVGITGAWFAARKRRASRRAADAAVHRQVLM